MTAVVTGATGFLGGALTRALLQSGTPVRILARSAERAQPLAEAGADVHLGNLDQPETLQGLIPAGSVVYHCAARVDMTGPLADFERTNIDGTRHLLAACQEPPRRFVQISSGAVYGAAALGQRVSADRIPAEPVPYNFYGRTKRIGEDVAREACEQMGCEWVVLRLGFLYGAGNRPLLDHVGPLLKKKRYVLLGKGENRIATLDVADAVSATITCGTHAAAHGRVYDAASEERVTQKEFFAETAAALGAPAPWRTIHPRLAHGLAGWTERVCGWLGRPAPFTRAMVDLLSADQVIDSSALEAETGWRPQVSFEEGMQRMRTWYRSEQSGQGRA